MIFFDTATCPGARRCIELCRNHTAAGWGVYIGGPTSGGQGWTSDVCRELLDSGIGVLPIYVGENLLKDKNGVVIRVPTLNNEIGRKHGRDAVRIMGDFPGPRVVLDIETETYDHDPAGAVQYWNGWRDEVRAAGLSPGVYAHVRQLKEGKLTGGFGWGAQFIQQSLKAIPDLGGAGIPHQEAAWQYANSFNLDGIEIDANVGNFTLNGGEDMPDEATFKQWVRDVLNEATAPGMVSGAGTIKETLEATRNVFNKVNFEVLPHLADIEARLERLEKQG